MVVSELISVCRRIIGDSSDSAALDAKVIVKSVLGADDVQLLIKRDETVPESLCRKAEEMAEKRGEHIPLAYIIKQKEFMSLPFTVDFGVLIPRTDTECIVEEIIKDVSEGYVLDIGCGSGAISVCVAKYIPNAKVYAVDISDKAISIARQNAENNGVSVEFTKADIFSYKTDMMFDCIVSNPPYIETAELDSLMPDVKDYEPTVALDGGEDGLKFYRRIIDFAKSNLKPRGRLYFELGWKQFEAVRDLLINNGFTDIKEIYDLAGIKRGCKAELEDFTNEKVFE